MDKINVGIIFGGESTEHEVSRRSAVHVIESLDKLKYSFRLIEVTKKGSLNLYNESRTDVICEKILQIDNKLKKKPVEISESLFYENKIDVVFSVIHGTGGEDGVLQGFLEMCGIPYVGSGVAASAVGFDKAMAKIMFAHEGIPQADYISVATENIDYKKLGDEVADRLGYPVFVKPSSGGSSVGIYKVKDEVGLSAAINKAAAYDRKIIIEEYIPGREFECAVIGGFNNAEALGVGEIIPCNEFYDYAAKYLDGESDLLIPAPIPRETAERVRLLATEAYQAIDCAGMARADFLLDRHTGALYVNEVNTIPGFTPISMYSKLWEASGISYPDLIDRLIQLALERHADKSQSATSFEIPGRD